MKNSNIDELLNGFIDGELTERQQTQVKRLLAHDEQIVKKLEELKKLKALMGALPTHHAPTDFLEQVKHTLERRTLLEIEPEQIATRTGARHLMFRKTLSYAAMIGLIAAFGAVIYNVIGPGIFDQSSIATNNWTTPAKQTEQVTNQVTLVKTEPKPITPKAPIATVFSAKLELKTNDFKATEKFLEQAMEKNNLSQLVPMHTQENLKTTYYLKPDRQSLNAFLTDLQNGWDKFHTASLSIDSEQHPGPVVIEKITPDQIAQIVSQNDPEKQIKVARYFAVSNNIAQLPLDENASITPGDYESTLTNIPKPLLTSSAKEDKKSLSQNESSQNIYLTIVITAVK